jgi:exodeoxyribonuclease V beta subunit
VLLAGLRSAIETPLGDVAGGMRLRDIRPQDRLDELEFELPLGGGEQPHGDLTPELIAGVLREHLHADDALVGYARALSDAGLRQRVRGYLTGFLDLVVRLPGERFVVIDYKTNWLAGPEEPLRLGHYRFAALRAEMEQRHYALQALLYLVALHRYLRWRLPAYDPARHIAGVVYAFVRGMTPAAACGVFGWRPPPGLVPALSDALDRGGVA